MNFPLVYISTNRHVLLLFVILSINTGYTQSNYDRYFDACNVKGSVTVYDYKAKIWHYTDSLDAEQESLPASTFKIINTLIGLETGALKSEDEILKFPGIPDTILFGNRPDTYHDMLLEEAFKKSVIWFYYDITAKVGRATYKKYLRKSRYGNRNLSQPGLDFWNFGEFGISPRNQIEFLIRVYERKKPFSVRSYNILKKVMLHEETPQYKIYAKTGWERNEDLDIGWWVGYLESKENVYFFATRIQKLRNVVNKDFSSCRKKITMKILEEVGFIKNEEEVNYQGLYK